LAAKITPKGVTLTIVDGILIIDKPAGITSHDVVARVRRALRTKRVGHTGTLDPFATGVVVVLVGKATRLAQFLDKDEKGYEAEVQFGWETDTGDNTGLRTAECGLGSEEVAERLASIEWGEVLENFRGAIKQVPPMYSAKKIEGKKLYELARKGIEVERDAVEVNIHKLEFVQDAALRTRHSALDLRVVCSAGTYIRTLAEDIGKATGLLAHLTALRRTRAGNFTLEHAVTLDALSEHDSPRNFLLPIKNAVSHLPGFTLREDRVGKTLSGMSTRDLSGRFADGESVAMFSPSGELIAVGRYMDEEKAVQPKVVLG
jgi:tRNA pseudouridine55 synthase